MKHLLPLFLSLALGGVACNGSNLTAEPQATPTPGPTATPPVPGAPVAVITGAASYDPLATADFSGTASHSPNGAIIGYAWDITARPSGSVSPLSSTSGSAVTFFVDLAGNYTLKLTVTDSTGATGSTTLDFTCVPSQALHIELTWVNQYTKADMDLHLVNVSQDPNNAKIYDQTGCDGGSTIATGAGCDCGWETCAKTSNGVAINAEVLDWYTVDNTPDDATLDIDNISVSVPENINIVTPKPGTYEVMVHYYSAEFDLLGNPLPSIPVDATVNVYLGGTLAWSGTQHYNTINQLWDTGTVTIPNSGSATFVAKTVSSTSTSNLTACMQPASAGGGTCDGI